MPSPAQASQPAGIYPDDSPILRPERESDRLPSAVPHASTATLLPAPLEGLSTFPLPELVSAAGAARDSGLATHSAVATAQQGSAGLPPFVLGPLPPLPYEREQASRSLSDDDRADILAYADAVPSPSEPVTRASAQWGRCDIIGHAAPAA
ncbi:hypothetical protein [Mycetohabitans rhizoxinica]|uniref:hypothetical protein n=1 Tax=Mycetohabitans rhizoxinica TaxID=412963 RepID=UPI0030D0283A